MEIDADGGNSGPHSLEKGAYDSVEAIRGNSTGSLLTTTGRGNRSRKAPWRYSGRHNTRERRRVLKGGVCLEGALSSVGRLQDVLLSLADFDPVCSAAIGRMIDFYADPGGK